MPTVASTLLLCLLGLAASPWPRRHVDLVFEGTRITPTSEAAAMEEVARIWAAYGVDIRKGNPITAGEPGASRLTVLLVERQDQHMASGALASISFFDDLPQPTIFVYPSTIATVVSSGKLLGLQASQWPPDLREQILGRVLGRALAHEIGHFLLRSRHHAEFGLMRANPPVSELIGQDRQVFFLSADEEKRLARMMTAASQAAVQ
jgi:hypothetical protein